MHSAYRQVFYGLPLLCEVIEGLLLWRLSRHHAVKHYPYLSAYICYDLVRTPTLLAVAFFGLKDFPSVYGVTNVPAVVLQFFMLWEVARSLFRPNSRIRQIAWKVFLVAQIFLIPAAIFVAWSQASLVRFPARSVAAGFEQYSSLSQALLLLLVAAVARYYGISFGRKMLAVIFSLGPYLLVNSVSFATYQVFGTLRPYLELLPAAAYTGMIAIWLYGFWQYAPSPQQALVHPVSKQQWNHVWETTLDLVRHKSS